MYTVAFVAIPGSKIRVGRATAGRVKGTVRQIGCEVHDPGFAKGTHVVLKEEIIGKICITPER